MTNNFLTSILITNYNKEKFLIKSLSSAIKQNYKKKEVIVYDDKSTDNSLKIIDRFKNIKILKNKSEKKKTAPLNQINGLIECFKVSRGDYIFLLDSDDEFKRNKISSIIKYFKRNKNLNIIQDKPYLKNEKKNLNLKIKKHLFSIWPSIYPTSCIAIRRSYFNEFLKYIEKKKFPNLEIDSRLIIFAFLKNDLKIINKSFTVYNFDETGITSNYEKFNIKWWKKRKEAFEYMEFLMKKLKLKFSKGPDFYFTKLINLFF